MPDFKHLLKTLMETYAEMNPDELRKKMLDLREAYDDLEDESRILSEENRALREQLKRRKDLERRKDAYYIIEDNGSPTGPVCPRCYLEDGIVVKLAMSGKGAYCPACKAGFHAVSIPGEDRSDHEMQAYF